MRCLTQAEVRESGLADLPVGEGRPLIIAAIPAYNEEKTIAKEVLRAKKYVNKVVVCDDGSTDMTSEIAETAGAEVIRHQENLGKGVALRSLFEVGRKLDADVLVTLDGDGQHEPEEIPRLAEPVLKGDAEIVVGCRFSHENHIPARRKVGNHVLNLFTGISTDEVSDVQSGFRAYSKTALDRIDVTIDGFGADSQILIDAKKKGIKVVEVPVSVRYPRDVKTSKKNIVQHGSEVIVSLIELISEKRPLLLLGLPGLLLFMVGSASFVVVLGIFNETRQFAIGTAILGVVSTLLGTLLVFAALILWVLGRRLRLMENSIESRVHDRGEYESVGN